MRLVRDQSSVSVIQGVILTIQENLDHIERHLTSALDAILNGTCKRKGSAYLQAALATLHEVRDALNEKEQTKRREDPTEVIYYR